MAMNGFCRTTVILLLIFLGFTGIMGGYELLYHLIGGPLKMPFGLLYKTPFEYHRIPGFLLFFGNGALGLLIAGFVWCRIKKYAILIILQGSFLIIWLTAQLLLNVKFFLPQTHMTYYALGIILVLAGLKLNRI